MLLVRDVYGPYPAVVSEIHDGDTIKVDILLIKRRFRLFNREDQDLGFNVWLTKKGVELKGQSVRFYGCNAPELSTDAGKASLATLETLIKVGDPLTLVSHGWDKYGGRIDGSLTLSDGRDLVQTMISLGAAVVWDGKGPKPV